MNKLWEGIDAQVAQELSIPQEDVYNILQFKNKELMKAFTIEESIEDVGFGKWELRHSSIQKRIKKLTEMLNAYNKELPNSQQPRTSTLNQRIHTASRELTELQERFPQYFS